MPLPPSPSTSLLEGRSVDVRAFLSTYFSDVSGLLSLMRTTGALISGSQVLQLLLGESYPGSDLDVFLAEEHSQELTEFVLREGYRETTRYRRDEIYDDDMYPSVTGVCAVTTLCKDAAVLQLVEIDFSPTSSILKFHSTAVMNFISWNRLVSLYPVATFKRISFALPVQQNDVERTTLAHQKYSDRGFEIVKHWSPKYRYLFPLGERRIGDRHCLVLPFAEDDDDSMRTDDWDGDPDKDIDDHRWKATAVDGGPNHLFDFVIRLQPAPKNLHTCPPFESLFGGKFLHVLDRSVLDLAI